MCCLKIIKTRGLSYSGIFYDSCIIYRHLCIHRGLLESASFRALVECISKMGDPLFFVSWRANDVPQDLRGCLSLEISMHKNRPHSARASSLGPTLSSQSLLPRRQKRLPTIVEIFRSRRAAAKSWERVRSALISLPFCSHTSRHWQQYCKIKTNIARENWKNSLNRRMNKNSKFIFHTIMSERF